MARHDDEILTDNTKIKKFEKCRNCALWGNGDAWSNAFDKSNCDAFPYPGMKPISIMNNGDCPYWIERVKG